MGFPEKVDIAWEQTSWWRETETEKEDKGLYYFLRAKGTLVWQPGPGPNLVGNRGYVFLEMRRGSLFLWKNQRFPLKEHLSSFLIVSYLGLGAWNPGLEETKNSRPGLAKSPPSISLFSLTRSMAIMIFIILIAYCCVLLPRRFLTI